MRKFLGLLCVLVVAQACTTAGPAQTPGTVPMTGCTDITDPDGPVICVDDSQHPPKMSDYGKKLHVHSKLANGDHTYVTWKTASGADLSIKMDPDANSGEKCYKIRLFHFTCSGGTCTIKVNPAAAKKQCEYNLWVNGVQADPIIIVDEWPFVTPVKE